MLQIRPESTENADTNIVRLESELNIKLPEDYKNFLLKYNGGWTPRTEIYFNGLEHGINSLNSVNSDKNKDDFKYYMNNNVDVIRNEFYQDLNNGYLNIGDWFGAYYYIGINPELDNYGAIYFMDEEREKFIYVCSSFKELTQKAITPDFQVRSPEENIQRFKEKGREDKITPGLIKEWTTAYNKYKDLKLVPVIID